MSKGLYDFKFKYNFIKGESVKWNKKIFKKCPFEIDDIKLVDEISEKIDGFVGIRRTGTWWNWWELVPTSLINKSIYWVKFYTWYFVRYVRFKKQNDNIWKSYK